MAKRSRINIADLQAMEQAYGRKLSAGKVITTAFPLVVIMTAFAALLYVSIIPTIIVAVLTSWFGFAYILPNEIAVNYFRKGMSERDNCLSILTQALSDPKNDTVYCLKIARDQATGEFKNQLSTLIAVLATASPVQEQRAAFKKLEDAYKDDIPFVQFFEQLETAQIHGIRDYEVFHSIALNHSTLYESEDKYIQSRKSWKTTVFFFVWLSFAPPVAFSLMFGFKTYVRTYAHSFIGIAATTVFLILFFWQLYRFYNFYYDESVTSLKKKKGIPRIGLLRNDKGVAERNAKRRAKQQAKKTIN